MTFTLLRDGQDFYLNLMQESRREASNTRLSPGTSALTYSLLATHLSTGTRRLHIYLHRATTRFRTKHVKPYRSKRVGKYCVLKDHRWKMRGEDLNLRQVDSPPHVAVHPLSENDHRLNGVRESKASRALGLARVIPPADVRLCKLHHVMI